MLRAATCLAICFLLFSAGIGPLVAADLYWTDKNDATIWRGDMDGATPRQVLLDWSDGLVEPRGLGLDLANRMMYWADAGAGTICRADLDGNGVQTLISGLPFMGDLELDLAAGKMYWAETAGSAIGCANLDGTGRAYLFSGATQPYYLALDLDGDMLYWGQESDTRIYRGRMDGTGSVEEAATGLNRVRDIGLDLANNTVYFNERDLGQVKRTELGSGVLQTLFTVPNGGKPHGMALDLDDQMIYWTTTGTDSIMRGNMDGSGGYELLYTSPGAPWDIELAIPEPSTLALVLVGAVSVLVVGWRRRRSAPARG
ncbi:MAG: PEP-CTERM sorting domain-containing protein [Pirellulales bacterium]|nr:PEP-CTERM sorting domain-containing protein [Pirellulales bacterium]